MAKHKGQNEGNELEKYLDNALNIAICQRLNGGDEEGLFEPLAFFNQLYSFYSHARINKSNKFAAIEKLDKTNLNHKQKSFLLYYLDFLLFEEEVKTCLPRLEHEKQSVLRVEGLSLVGGSIQEEWAKLGNSIGDLAGADWVLAQGGVTPDIVKNPGVLLVERLKRSVLDRYNFNRVKHYLKTLPSYKTKIAYLFEIKTEYLQQSNNVQLNFRGFDHQCNCEIEKLEKLAALGQPSNAINEAHIKDVKHKPEFTMEQIALAMYYLLEYSKAKCSNTKKAKFISFLTGFSENTIRPFLSGVHTKKNDNRIAWEKDMKVVKQRLELLGWPELVKMVDNDLNLED